MDIKSLAEQYNDYIIDRRRYYHTCPELSGEEKNTRAHLKEDLEALGITDIHELETCYGLTATIHGGKPGKTVALRADIDALPVKEETGLPFASHNEGKMHACGHDNHMAMLLGAAKILNEVKDELSGDVRLVFQPAEETAVGALRMMEEHALDGVDAIYGVHVWGTYDAPGIAFPAGNLMACCHGFTIEVEGKSAHASAPHEGVDAVMVASSILQSIQQLVSRMNDPLNPLVITVGKVTAGNRWNVLAGHATLEGTVRTFRFTCLFAYSLRDCRMLVTGWLRLALNTNCECRKSTVANASAFERLRAPPIHFVEGFDGPSSKVSTFHRRRLHQNASGGKPLSLGCRSCVRPTQ